MWGTAAWKQLLLLPTVTKMKRFCQALHIQTKSHHCLAWLLSGALKLSGVSPASTIVLFLRKYIHCIYIHFMSHGPVLHWLADWCHSGRVRGWSCGTDGKLTCQLCRIQPDSDWYLSSAAGSCHMLIPDTQAGQLRSPQSPSHAHTHTEACLVYLILHNKSVISQFHRVTHVLKVRFVYNRGCHDAGDLPSLQRWMKRNWN